MQAAKTTAHEQHHVLKLWRSVNPAILANAALRLDLTLYALRRRTQTPLAIAIAADLRQWIDSMVESQ